MAEIQSAANMAFAMYPGLTHGAYEALLRHGSEEQKDMYLPNMASGKWTGTMNLTEPHYGTDLGLMRTKAEPKADDSPLIRWGERSGGKEWGISGRSRGA